MAALGDILRIIPGGFMFHCNLTQILGSAGNGPISNSAPFVASSGALIVVFQRGSGGIVRRGVASPSGIWEFYDLTPGPYLATEAGAARQWQIDVAADLSFTVTPVASSFPFNASSGYIG